jgi:putative ABC transport system permease protein
MTLHRYIIRQVKRQPWRSGLTLMGIVIGVQALVAIPVTILTTRQAYRTLFEGLTGDAALEIVAHGQGGFDSDTLPLLHEIAGVRQVVPIVQGTAACISADGTSPVMIQGIDFEAHPAARNFSYKMGQPPSGMQAVITRDFAGTTELSPGDAIKMLTAAGLNVVVVSGVIEPDASSAMSAGVVVTLPLDSAAQLLDLRGGVTALQVVLEEDADETNIRAAIAGRLPPGMTVRSPAARAGLVGLTFATTEQLLSTLSVISLGAGAFVILNAFLMSINERRRELAILRAVGATRQQVERLLVYEGLCLGALGSLIGVPVGIGTAWIMMIFMEQMMVTALPAPDLSAGPLLLAGALGPIVAFVATKIPARKAAAQAPLEGITGRRVTECTAVHRTAQRVGAALLAIGVISVFVVVYVPLPKWAYVYLLPSVMLIGMIGLAAIIPLFVPLVTRGVKRIMQALFGFEGTLAVRQVNRQPTRSALVVMVLAISVLVSVAFGNSIMLSLDDLYTWCDRVIASDFLIRAHAQEPSTLMTASIPADLAEELSAHPDIACLDRLAFVPAQTVAGPVIVLARTWAPNAELELDIVEGHPDQIRSDLARGDIVIGTSLGQRSGKGVGNMMTLYTLSGPIELRIAGLVTEYTAGGSAIYMDWAQAGRLLNVRDPQVFMINATEGHRSEVASFLAEVGNQHNLVVQSQSGFRAKLDEMISGIVGMFWVLVALVFVVASLGMTNALTMNVIEQTRELGVLRAVAMKRRQLRRLVIAQAVTLGLVSLVPGVIFGLLLSYALVVSTYPVTGIHLDYDMHATMLIGCPMVAVVIAVAAALPPARRAARLNVVAALQYE